MEVRRPSSDRLHNVSTNQYFDLRPGCNAGPHLPRVALYWLTIEILTPGIYPRLLVMHIYE
jgi:hypothetical protein